MRPFRTLVLTFALLAASAAVSPARADEVTDWNGILFRAAATAGTSPLFIARNAAIVTSAVFDALNGIEGTYTPIHVDGDAPKGASRRAAIVEAAYDALLHLYASQKPMLDAAREASLDGIASGAAAENSVSIERGIAWGHTVAEAIWTWRLTDGFSSDGVTPPPLTFDNGPAPYANGAWRPTPPGFLKGVGYPSFFSMTPWVMAHHYSFRPGPPPAISSQQYVNDFNETKAAANFTRSHPTADETILSLFWNAGTAAAYWNRAALAMASDHHFTLTENARLLAAVNLSLGDAAIACWDAKYTYNYWRPITAITIADDGNTSTVQDATWNTLFVTPNHPEYPSGPSCQSGAAAQVLARYFGDKTPFSLESNTVPGQIRQYSSLSGALEEVKNARVFAGIHFRTATEVGQALGVTVANNVLENALQPVHGNKNGQQK
jgi:hypothetical protein